MKELHHNVDHQHKQPRPINKRPIRQNAVFQYVFLTAQPIAVELPLSEIQALALDGSAAVSGVPWSSSCMCAQVPISIFSCLRKCFSKRSVTNFNKKPSSFSYNEGVESMLFHLQALLLWR